jgi:hypothetical protein
MKIAKIMRRHVQYDKPDTTLGERRRASVVRPEGYP